MKFEGKVLTEFVLFITGRIIITIGVLTSQSKAAFLRTCLRYDFHNTTCSSTRNRSVEEDFKSNFP